MLIDILKRIFQDNQFVELEIDFDSGEYQYFLAIPNPEQNRQEYFLVLEKENTTANDINMLIETGADDFFEMIRKSDQVDESFKKNCTLIFCLKRTDVNLPLGEILRLEEDPYNFKKNVIAYTVEELDSWEDSVLPPLSVENLNVMIANDAAFSNFKEGEAKDSYSLLMKIAIKLPFVRYVPQVRSSLYDLSEEIRKKLSEEELSCYDFLIQELDLKQTEEKIEALLLSEWKIENE